MECYKFSSEQFNLFFIHVVPCPLRCYAVDDRVDVLISFGFLFYLQYLNSIHQGSGWLVVLVQVEEILKALLHFPLRFSLLLKFSCKGSGSHEKQLRFPFISPIRE